MLIGIVSDTHGRTDAMASAVQMLQARGAGYFIHCGDVGSVEVLDYLAGQRAGFVWGNCDWDRVALQRYGQKLDIECFGAFGELTIDGKRIALLHGDDGRQKGRVLLEQRHDYLLQGHTHARQDERVGGVRVINPGALHRANPKTAALLDPAADRLDFLVIA